MKLTRRSLFAATVVAAVLTACTLYTDDGSTIGRGEDGSGSGDCGGTCGSESRVDAGCSDYFDAWPAPDAPDYYPDAAYYYPDAAR